MGVNSKIQWTEHTWNPVRGCSLVSPGCRSCYAMKQAGRFSNPGQPFDGFVEVVNGHFVWTGKVEPVEAHLKDPMKWKKPAFIFTNSMTDIFHEKVPFEYLDKIYAVMALANWHTFQNLTKRPERRLEYLSDPETPHRIAKQMDTISVQIKATSIKDQIRPIKRYPGYSISNSGKVFSTLKAMPPKELLQEITHKGRARVPLYVDGQQKHEYVHRLVLETFDRKPEEDEQACHIDGNPINNHIANLRWGSQSDNWKDRIRHGNFKSFSKLTQDQVDQMRRLAKGGESVTKIAGLFDVSDTQVRNIVSGKQWSTSSFELGQWPIPWIWEGVSVEDQKRADERLPYLLATPAALRWVSYEPALELVDFIPYMKGLDWIVVGGESGPGARPFDIEWAASTIRQGKVSDVPIFVKQMGLNPVLSNGERVGFIKHPKGDVMEEWPASLRVRQWPKGKEPDADTQ